MKGKVIFVAAILLGLVTSMMIYGYLNKAKETMNTTEYIEIVIAVEDINANTVVSANMVELKEIPAAYKHPNAVTDVKEVTGKIALIPITRGESILSNQVISSGEHKQGLAYKIPQGKRALSIAVNEVSGVSGLLKVGDRVDIITTINAGEDPPITYTLVVLQDIEILAVGRNINQHSNENPEAKTVTVAVSLEDSLPLKHANQRGAISLMLRSPIDDSKTEPEAFQVEDFLEE
ncbi:pilus assembly protein CpaB [Natronincola peptidivorans]|uniref:Pilus assembly protein CpaB n=1 Tax=Natronincola peptidivorans TaxID=426128 RepID=A0A1I0FNE7_9FIRM|nr:Flp pilus assembly protein CpaB [Natronincola peptidivorans]SET59766.1 pilus assembly protein CpaB [Natronincola peptidivorans]